MYAFAYHGLHAEALGHRKEWFQNPHWPTYVAWWVEDGQLPTREEGVKRLERLHDHGPTPHAFNFKTLFDASRQATTLDRHKVEERARVVKEYAERNPHGL